MNKDKLKIYIKTLSFISNQEQRDTDKTIKYLDQLIKEKTSPNKIKRKKLIKEVIK